jgi:hypothetical protein
MSLSQVRTVLGDAKAWLTGNDPEVPLNSCAYLESPHLPSGIGLMFAKGRVVRIDVFEGSTKTSTGAGIGDSEDRVKTLYADRIRVEPHRYVDGGHYLYYVPTANSQQRFGIVFETNGHEVISFRVGTLAAIGLVEGCA